jgi:hypothetical protein
VWAGDRRFATLDRMDHDFDSTWLTPLATASSFLCAVVAFAFGVTDAACASEGSGLELAVAALAATSFVFFLSARHAAWDAAPAFDSRSEETRP